MESIIEENANWQMLRTKDPGKAIKTLRKEFPEPEDIVLLNNEYNLLHGLSIEGVCKVLRKFQHEGRLALEMECPEDQRASEFKLQEGADLPRFLTMAASIAGTLAEIHRHGIIHLNLNDRNICLNGVGKAQILNFSIASKYDVLMHNLGSPESLQGNLSYISPEQTGRMNRMVDFRSDLYSLGVVFYRMLCGQLPFISNDPLELVHFHLAKNPTAPHLVNAIVPEVLSNIVMKLLAKNADERYQSASGLQHDLQQCAYALKEKGEMANFELAGKDSHGRFVISQKLYGREIELTEIMNGFSRAVKGGVELLLVSGEPGVGKSALVNEIHRVISERRGFFISGKFDQLQRNIPYYAIRKAFTEWVQLILTERDEKLQVWKQTIQESVGGLGQVLLNLLPEMSLLIGVQPAVPELGGREAQNRFNYVFRNFIKAIADEAHPLVIFIDDLQWVDSASLELLKIWLTDSENKHLMVIGAYRDNEVDETHPLRIALNQLVEEHVSVENINLQKLKRDDVEQLIADSLFASTTTVQPLAHYLFEKTGGNPIFLRQFMESLYKSELLWFDKQERHWQWNLSALDKLQVSDGVVGLMTAKIKKMPKDSQEILKLAACIGNNFDVQTLAIIAEISLEETVSRLLPAIGEGMILPMSTNFRFIEAGVNPIRGEAVWLRFIHDRVQQSFYGLIPADQKQKLHLRVGRLLMTNLTEAHREEGIFDLVYQLNEGRHLIENPKERIELASYNLRAGRKAIESSAYGPALQFLQTGISLLPKDLWQQQYSLTAGLYGAAAEAAFLGGEYELMDEFIDTYIEQSKSAAELGKVYMLRVDHLTALNRLPEALDIGLEILDKLGVSFTKKPKMLHVISGLIKTKFLLRNKKTEDLEHLPEMTDPAMRAALPILERAVPPAYMSGSMYFPLIVFKMVELSVKHGNMEYSAFGYGSFGISLSAVLGDFDGGYRFGQMALRLVDRFDSEEYRVKVLFVTDVFLNHWKQHLKLSIQPLLESYQSGLKVGNLVGGSWSAYYHLLWYFYTGMHLKELASAIAPYEQNFRQLNQDAASKRLAMLRHVVENLSTGREVLTRLDEPERTEEEILSYLHDINDKTSIYFYHLNKILLYTLANQPYKAFEHSASSLKYAEAVAGLPELTHFHFYDALACFYAFFKDGKKDHLKKIKKHIAKFKKWSKKAPDNYLHIYEILTGARAAIRGDYQVAIDLFGQGLRHAREQEYIPDEAMGHELAGRCFMYKEQEILAQTFIAKASGAYRQWGAVAKVAMLQTEYAFLNDEMPKDGTASPSSHTENLDLNTLMKASTTISSEIRLDKLLRTMLKIMIENAGAQRGALILEVNEEFMVMADGTVDSVKVLQNQLLETYPHLPVSAINYSLRTREDLVLNNAVEDEKFGRRGYVQTHQSKSLMCTVILHQGEVRGVLFLENKLASNAFTSERVKLLKLLSGQIAISLDNALLYNHLEEKVVERTHEIDHQKKKLEIEKQKTDNLLLNILPVETAEELKKDGKTKARFFKDVSVLFLDITGFTQIAENLSPQALVDEIDFYFCTFDNITAKHKLEKIKTIGDAYMAVGGMPENNEATAVDVVAAAMEIQDFMKKEMAQRQMENKLFFEVRAGIHTGPVVAGVVGTRKFQFDIWGDTVNIAARMEQHSDTGRINISYDTYQLVKEAYQCEHRGKLTAKNKGALDMYFVSAPVK